MTSPLQPQPARAVAKWLACLAMFMVGCGSEDLGSFDRVVVQRDLLETLADWKVVAGPPGVHASLGTMTPSYSAHHDSGDLPALLLKPGMTVSYTFPQGEAPAILRGAAGVDLTVPRQLKPGSKPLRVHFLAQLDGQTVLDQVVPVHPTANNHKTAKVPQIWHWLGGKQDGLAVCAGQTLSLKIELRGRPRPKLGELRLGFGGLLTETSIPTQRMTASAESPNIVLVVMDTLRADRTSLHGYGNPTTPRLDRLAASGLQFEEAYAPAPWTWPSTASLFTGLAPADHGVTGHDACYLRHGLPTLPKALQARGFSTAALSGNPLIVPDKNFDAGFEHFDWSKEFTPGAELMPRALSWLRSNGNRRFFLYLHLVDPHDPHRPLASELARLGGLRPAGYGDRGYLKLGGKLRKLVAQAGAAGVDFNELVVPGEVLWINDAYDACVGTGDVYLGQLLDLLDELQLTQKTVVAFTSDHGEELFDHGLTNHAHTLHPELLHVPLVIAGPGVPAGLKHSERISIRHLASTLARLGGAQLPVEDSVDLFAQQLPPSPAFYSHTTKGIWNDQAMVEIFGLMEDDWAFHWAPAALPFRTLPAVDPGPGQWKLYDRRMDPGEQQDLSTQHPAEVERMRALITAWREQQRVDRQGFGVGASTRGLLEGVGYIGSSQPHTPPPTSDK